MKCQCTGCNHQKSIRYPYPKRWFLVDSTQKELREFGYMCQDCQDDWYHDNPIHNDPKVLAALL